MQQSWRLVLALAGGLAACDSPASTEIAGPRAPSPSFNQSGHDDGDDAPASAVGAGIYRLQDAFDVKFAFAARIKENGKAKGVFRQHLVADGLVIDFTGKVTCLVFDATNNRAWIGGVITKNRSTDPAFTGDIFQPGHDVWFRVVDYGRAPSAAQPDRTTFLGFENNPTIKSSEQYCREKPWPAGDLRTWPVTKGDIEVE
jgi:hypothetical protein